MRRCRRDLHDIPDGKEECPTCRKTRNDRHRANARKAGKDARRQREWYAARYADPVFAERERQRFRDRNDRPEYALSRRLGVSVSVGRQILKAAA